MKKNIYLLMALALLIICSSKNANAQVTPGITIQSAGDTTWLTTACGAPDSLELFCYGTAGGYTVNDSVTVYIAYGDGYDTTYMSPIYQGHYFSTSVLHIYTVPGIYSLLFIVTGPNGAADTLVNNNTVLVGSQCGNISGKVYYDLNGDCVYNAGDTAIQYARVCALYNGNVQAYAYSNSAGDYFLTVPAGVTYTIECNYYNVTSITTVCPASGIYTVATLPSANNDFGMSCNANGHDLSGYLYITAIRPGPAAYLYLHFWNLACSPVSGTVTVTLPAGVSYITSVPAPASVNGQVITYTVNPYDYNWLSGWLGGPLMTVLGSPSLVVGDTVCFTMVMDPIAGDLNPANNTVSTCIPVRASCDPNEKFEAVAKWGTANVAPEALLDYTIGFQNIGNDDAYKVVVLDELDADVDMNTLEITAASHAMNVYVINNNTLKFEFLNINLPAASVNEALSHGHVSYKVKAKSGLANGTAIDNSAEIFFDFNAPIVTNNVRNIIDIALGLNEHDGQLVITTLPNPATDYIRIHTASTSLSYVSLYDMSGKLVVRGLVEDKGTISLADVNKGVYMITVMSDNKTYTGKIVVVK